MRSKKTIKRLSTVLAVVIIVTAFIPVSLAAEINVGDLLDKSQWTVNGDNVSFGDAIVFDTAEAGVYTAIKTNNKADNATYLLNVTLDGIPQGLSMDEPWDWWDAELLIMARASEAGNSSTDGQTGYCITSWGDFNTFYVGKYRSDDYLTPDGVAWPLGDGKAHDIAFTTENQSDGSVKITVAVDGNKLFEGVDKGEVAREDRFQNVVYTDAGSLNIRAKYVKATVKGVAVQAPPSGGSGDAGSTGGTGGDDGASAGATTNPKTFDAISLLLPLTLISLACSVIGIKKFGKR